VSVGFLAKSSYKVLLGKPEGRRRLPSSGKRSYDIVLMELSERGLAGVSVEWIQLVPDRDFCKVLQDK
jgi:hypothetical protein